MSGLSIQFLQKFIYLINSVNVDRLKKKHLKEIRVQNKMSNDIQVQNIYILHV
jgi:hypothetical protein